MKKALLIAALSFTVSPFALADHHEGGHGDAAKVAVDEAAPAVESVVNDALPAAVPVEAVQEAASAPAPAVEPAPAPVVKVIPKKHSAHWGYTGSEAAHKWGDLDAQYHACKAGVEQSPINISQFQQDDLPALSTSYAPSPLEVFNNGHTVQVNYAPGSGFRQDNKNFTLLQFHFHTPSEHYIDGAPYPMEVHFVHKANDGTLGVIGVMMKVGAHNPTIEGIWQNVPPAGETKRVESVSLSASDLMPANKGYYAYNGSLTTPPCSEGVKWHVMQEPIEISAEQLTAFQSVFPVNARPIQGLGERTVKGN